jgi:hydrogenase/urease accessory protein HupE
MKILYVVIFIVLLQWVVVAYGHELDANAHPVEFPALYTTAQQALHAVVTRNRNTKKEAK